MPSFVVRPRARIDIDGIWDYIAEDSDAQADAFVDRMTAKFKLLARQPELGRMRDDLMTKLRSFPFERYVIFYRTSYIDGGEDGRWQDFHENGSIAAKGNYERGQETGTWHLASMECSGNTRLGVGAQPCRCASTASVEWFAAMGLPMAVSVLPQAGAYAFGILQAPT